MERLSSTAEEAPSNAASATASRFPVASPKARERMTIPAQTHVIAIEIPPLKGARSGCANSYSKAYTATAGRCKIIVNCVEKRENMTDLSLTHNKIL